MGREKGTTKVSSTGGKAPGYRFSPGLLQMVKQLLAPDWAQKILGIVVPIRRTASLEFFSYFHIRPLLSRHTCPVRSPKKCTPTGNFQFNINSLKVQISLLFHILVKFFIPCYIPEP